MIHQKMATTETVATGAISSGGTTSVEVPTWCNDIHTTPAPPGRGETGAGAPYTVQPVSPEIVKMIEALTDLAETGMLHNEVLGMPLSPYAETVGQVEIWMRAGEDVGQPYTWDQARLALATTLAARLGREPRDEEVQAATQPIQLDVCSLRIKQNPGAVAEHLRLLGNELASEVLAQPGATGPVTGAPVCSCNRILVEGSGDLLAGAPVCSCNRIIIPEEVTPSAAGPVPPSPVCSCNRILT